MADYSSGEPTLYQSNFSVPSGVGMALETTDLPMEAKLALTIAASLGLGGIDAIAGALGGLGNFFTGKHPDFGDGTYNYNVQWSTLTDEEKEAHRQARLAYVAARKARAKHSTGIGSSPADIAAYNALMNNRFANEAKHKKLVEDYHTKHSTDANYLNSNITRPSTKTVLTPEQLIAQQTAQQGLENNITSPAVNQTLVNQIVRNRIVDIRKAQQIAAEQLKANQATLLANQATQAQLSSVQTKNLGTLLSNSSKQLAQTQANRQTMTQSQQNVLNATIAQQKARTGTVSAPVTTLRRIPPPAKGVIGSGSKLLKRVMSDFNMSKSEAKRYIKKYGDL